MTSRLRALQSLMSPVRRGVSGSPALQLVGAVMTKPRLGAWRSSRPENGVANRQYVALLRAQVTTGEVHTTPTGRLMSLNPKGPSPSQAGREIVKRWCLE